MISKDGENVTGEFLYRLGHPLGEFVIQAGKDYPTPVAKVMFDISGHDARISVVDMVMAAEKELRDTKEQIKALNRQARQATTVEEQYQLQEKIKALEKKKRRQRQRIFDVEDEIMEKRDSLINALEKRMQQRTESNLLFTVRWEVV